MIRTVYAPRFSYLYTPSAGEDIIKVFQCWFPLFLVEARPMSENKGEGIMIFRIEIRVPVTFGGSNERVSWSWVKDVRFEAEMSNTGHDFD